MNIKTLINSEPILSNLKNCYIDIGNSHNDISFIKIWKNKKDFTSGDETLVLTMCSFRIFEDHFRAVEESDFDQKLAITGFHFGLWTNPDCQRQGFATSLYVLAELIFELPVRPSNDRTEYADFFWNQPNRPFGELIYS